MPTQRRQSSSLLSPKKAPAKKATPARPAVSLEDELLAADMPVLPPMPDTPPPVPEGEVLGFAPEPTDASAAAPITEAVEASGEVPVDPTTGEKAYVPETTTAGRSAELKIELEVADAKRQAEKATEIARHEAGRLPVPTVHSPGTPANPMHKVPLAEHDAKQREYKEHMLSLRRNGAGTIVVEPDIEASLETETAQEARARSVVEAKQRYESRVAAMAPDEPRYVATGRAPRPKVEGHPLQAGDVVPGAYLYTRLESWLNAKIITSA
jgi:hypothetical protein